MTAGTLKSFQSAAAVETIEAGNWDWNFFASAAARFLPDIPPIFGRYFSPWHFCSALRWPLLSIPLFISCAGGRE